MLKSLHVVLALALLLAMIGDSAAKSQRPSPSNRESNEPPQTQSTQSKEPAPQYPRGTEESPAFVKIIPTPDEQQRAAAETKREDEKAANDRSIALFTGRLFWATVALSVIAVGQLFAFLWQGLQLKRSVDRAKEEFISTHRPRLIVRQFEVDPILRDHVITIHFSIINTGDTNATWRFIAAEVALWTGDRWEAPGIDPVQRSIPPTIITNGERIGGTIQSRFELSGDQFTRIAAHELIVCAVGEFTYTDDLGTKRRTGFRRNYDPSTNMFTASKNEDQEYQD